MQDHTVLQSDIALRDSAILEKLKKFRAMFVSSNICNNQLLEMIESYLTSENINNLPVENIHVLDGQLSLFDY